ncbi:hypothetical protein [Azospirillum canadense]|uniref:hypothetical protein n=1 Tax=Azospirillum canadense TaxID=403962 RepID=UPI0022271059|nr:hypothetical protein [Azospirillum canadense]MCW2242786.1 DNA-binding IscR family transcriptional regulator [Azospirillum canadense]
MTPSMLTMLRATPAACALEAQRIPVIAERAKLSLSEALAIMPALTAAGYVETIRVPRDLLYCRTAAGDRVARGWA